MLYNPIDCFAPSDSTRVASTSPSWTSHSFVSASTVTNPSPPFRLLSNDYPNNGSWAIEKSNDGEIAYTGEFRGSPSAANQKTVGAAVRQSPTPPTAQMDNLSLSAPSLCAPCGPVTFVPTSTVVAPCPVSSSPPLIDRAWPAQFQPPPILANSFQSRSPPQPPPDIPRPFMQAKIPPEKGRKPFLCLQAGCRMNFRKRNALVQHIRSHTGERPEVCQYCKRGFSVKCNLRRHYKTCKEKKATDRRAAGIRPDPPGSPGSFGQSPASSASSPLSTTTVASSLDSPTEDVFAAPPFLWDAGFSVDPSQQRSALDMTCGNPFFTQSDYPPPCPALVQAECCTSPYFPTPSNPPDPPQHPPSI